MARRRGRGAPGAAGVGRGVPADPRSRSSPRERSASSSITRISSRGRHDHGGRAADAAAPSRRLAASRRICARRWAPASSWRSSSQSGAEPFLRGLASVSPSRRSSRRSCSAPIAPPPPRGGGGSLAGRLGLPLGWGESVAAYYRSQFLNSVLPGGVVGDVAPRGRRTGAASSSSPRRPAPWSRSARRGRRCSSSSRRWCWCRSGCRPTLRAVGIVLIVVAVACVGLVVAARVSARVRGALAPRAGRPCARVRDASARSCAVSAASARRDRGARGDLRRRVRRRRRRSLARATRSRSRSSPCSRVDPAQHRRMGTARGRGRVGVRRRRARGGGGHRGLDRVRGPRADRRRTRCGRGRGIRSAPPARRRGRKRGRRSPP